MKIQQSFKFEIKGQVIELSEAEFNALKKAVNAIPSSDDARVIQWPSPPQPMPLPYIPPRDLGNPFRHPEDNPYKITCSAS